MLIRKTRRDGKSGIWKTAFLYRKKRGINNASYIPANSSYFRGFIG
jgi:hypothetical protein